jgi:energy-coupling factor transporter ATP-binding protein EcfA2
VARLTYLRLNELGNVAPKTELHFGPHKVVLLGRNGTGKTTLLNTIVTLLGGTFSDFEAPYDIYFELTADNGSVVEVGIREAAAKEAQTRDANSLSVLLREQTTRHPELAITVRLSGGQGNLSISHSGNELRYTLADGKAGVVNHDKRPGWLSFFPLLFQVEHPQSAALREVAIEIIIQSFRVHRFDEALDFFNTLTEAGAGGLRIAGTTSADNAGSRPPGDLGASLETAFASPALATAFMDELQRDSTVSTPMLRERAVPYLRVFAKLAGFQRASVSGQVDERIEDNGIIQWKLNTLSFYGERRGRLVHHRHFSFGQKRLLSFLHFRDFQLGVLVADELVNGMHYDWIAKCIDTAKPLQCFFTSQNPLLFDFMTFESAAEVKEQLVTCKLDNEYRFVWRNISDEAATQLFETYETGIQPVGEMLRTKGYW